MEKGLPQVYLTTCNTDIRFERQNQEEVLSVYDAGSGEKSGCFIRVNPEKRYQEFEGFGASMTDTSAYNISSMSDEMRDGLMKRLFSTEEGIGLSFLRQPIGTADFNVDWYTYDDIPYGEHDFELEHFSIEKDKRRIIPLIKHAKKLNPDLKLFGAVWTPPVWMKTGDSWFSDNKEALRPECYDVFARYLIKYLQAYKAEGLPIYTLSPQNEISADHRIAACYYNHTMMGEFVRDYLRPYMDKHQINTKLLAWDFNWFDDQVWDHLKEQEGCIDGVAFHFYWGESELMGRVSQKYPELPIYLSECAGMRQSQQEQLFRQIKYMTEAFRNNVSAYILWNICLDQNLGPTDFSIFRNGHGTGLTEYDTEKNTLYYQMDFYALAHFSKFVRPGARVIECTDISIESNEKFYDAAFKNTDGSIVVVVGNNSTEPETFQICIDNQVTEYTLEGHSVVTIAWK